jgi:hypothetical protein
MEDWEIEFSDHKSMYEELLLLRQQLAKEKSKNAFIETTGKGIADIGQDAIYEMLFKLKSDSSVIETCSIQKYAEELTK